jgi:hypothetical protein
MIDIHRDKMSRKEFCWLTDPQPPTAEARSNTSLILKWDPIRFCGVDVSVVSDSITYILEGCEGQEWKGGIASKFISDLTASDYKLIAKGSNLNKIILEDLKPARWYHFRLTIEYLSTRVTSTIKSFATICSPPNQPNQPYVYLIMNENNMFENKSRRDPQVRLSWNEPNPNGSSIKKYQIQVMEYFESYSEMNANNKSRHSNSSPESNYGSSMANTTTGLGTEEKEETDPMHTQQQQQRQQQQFYTSSSGKVLIGNKWRTVYCNLVKTALLESPRARCKAWGIRMRALNNSGWSSFSEIIYLDHQTHPQLFTSTSSKFIELNSYEENKLPPLLVQKQSTSISGTRSAPRLNQPQSFPQSKSKAKTKTGEGSEYHNGNLDMWSASASSFSYENMRGKGINEEEDTSKTSERDDWAYRSSATPHLRYNQPRCKTPSLLLPSSPTRPSAADALNRSLTTSSHNSNQQLQTEEPNSSLSPQDVDLQVLEREVERSPLPPPSSSLPPPLVS